MAGYAGFTKQACTSGGPVPIPPIDLLVAVHQTREKLAEDARKAFDGCLAWLLGPAQDSPLHTVERELLARLMALGCALMAVWLTTSVPTSVLATTTHGRSSYRFRALEAAVVRTRFGEVEWARPVYERVHGRGPLHIAPQDGVVGLAAGRMTLGVHLLAGYLAAKMPFDAVVDVLSQFAGYVPSKRTILGIVDKLGPHASALMADMPLPVEDGEILVIQNDDKGAGMISKREHARRCKPHQKGEGRGAPSRAGRRRHRRENPRQRRGKGEKSKNARMAKVFVIYTLKRMPDGTLEGPLNKRVIATFGSRRHAFALAQKEALKRGYGKKPTYFLADGSRAIWKLQEEFFPLATPCVDWYHVCEYLWLAGGTIYKDGTIELAGWVHARKGELLGGQIAEMLAAMTALRARIGGSGPGTKGRRVRLARAIGYIERHRARLRYADLAKVDMDIATGAVEGAVNNVVGQRLDGSMMRWTLARADHVLALRCILVSGLWTELAEAVAKAHSRCRDPVIPRITPSRPQEPYDAARKVA
jgi:hypothetical protein